MKEFLSENLPEKWKPFLYEETKKPYFKNLENFLEKEYENNVIYPSKKNIFNALRIVSPENIKVVILGQDPYHEPNQAHGLAFSVEGNTPFPKSLINIFKELHSDTGLPYPATGNLTPWAKQGVLLLNTVLTVREGDANNHKERGWERFTAEILKIVLSTPQPKIFVLWGKQAQDTFDKIITEKDYENYSEIRSPHPSPLSAYRGFFGSKPFTKINAYLNGNGLEEINWKL